MTRRSKRLLPTPMTLLLALLLVTPAALAQEADWDLTPRVATSADDSEEFLNSSIDDPQRWPAGFSYAESSDLELGRDATHAPQIVGLRYRNLQIPAGAQIDRAVIEFTADSDQSGPLAVTIRAQDAVENEQFIQDQDGQGSFDLTSRPATEVAVTWSPEGWTEGQPYTSPDISGILQQLVDREVWQPGSSIVLLLGPGAAGGDGLRSAHAYDSNPQLAPRLLVSFSGGTGLGEGPAQPEPVEPEDVQEPVETDEAVDPPAEPAEDQDAGEPSDAGQETVPPEVPEPREPAVPAPPAAQPAAPEVEVEPVDPDPIIPSPPEQDSPSVWAGPTDADEQATAPGQDAGQDLREADDPAPRDDPRRQRFPLVPNFPGGLRGSVLLSDYGGGVTVVTVFLDNPDPEVSYAASVRQGECGSRGQLIVDLEPIQGNQAFSTSLLSLGFEELLGGGYSLTIYRTAADFVRVAACAMLDGG